MIFFPSCYSSTLQHGIESNTNTRCTLERLRCSLSSPPRQTTLHVGTPRGRRPPPLATATTTGAARTGADGHLPLEKANKAGGWSGLGASNLGHFVELFEVQVAVVVLIYLDLVASTAQLLPYFQQPEEFERRGEREGGAELAGAWIGRLITRFMQVGRITRAAPPGESARVCP